MKRLYLLRHANTVYNRMELIQGWIDSPLTEEGISQSIETGEFIRSQGYQFDHIYCSPIGRAVSTLKYAMGDDVKFETDDRIKEQYFGSGEGKPFSLIPLGKPMNYIKETFGGEDDYEVRARVCAAMKDYMNRDDHESVLVVTHGCAAMNFLRSVEPSMQHKHTGDVLTNCAIAIFEYDGEKFYLVDVVHQGKLV